MYKVSYKINFTSHVEHVKQIVTDILQFISGYHPELSVDDKSELRLIFSELLFNAVVHGNRGDYKKNVYLFVEISDDILFSTITDEGQGFDYTRLLSNREEDFTSENGRGIRLVNALTDSMTFNTAGNEIKIHKRMTLHG